MRYKVIKAYNEAPSNPIDIKQGEMLTFIEESDHDGDWPNWIFCKGENKEGWVPKQILNIKETEVIVSEDYNAREHSLAPGEILIPQKYLNGWLWGYKTGNPTEMAWAPLNHLEKIVNLRLGDLDIAHISSIKSLWEQLNTVHLQDSTHFKNHYKNFTFEKRIENLTSKEQCEYLIKTLLDDNEIVGYCLCSINRKVGEIDSLFIQEDYREYGYGRNLVQAGLQWFEENYCEKVQVSVAAGHESVLGFYEKFGFYPRLTYLVQKRED